MRRTLTSRVLNEPSRTQRALSLRTLVLKLGQLLNRVRQENSVVRRMRSGDKRSLNASRTQL